jgi:hypothetical protein
MGAEGTWYNELNSTMILKITNGVLSGTYQSPKGDAPDPQSLTGKIDPSPSNGSQVLGWVVQWVNPAKPIHAVTVWSGQYQEVNGEEIITTEWLLTDATDPDDDWEATLVGHDTFKRTAPPKNLVDFNEKTKGASHPRSKT